MLLLVSLLIFAHILGLSMVTDVWNGAERCLVSVSVKTGACNSYMIETMTMTVAHYFLEENVELQEKMHWNW